jgi:pyridoxal phosphate-dependent aminotransferase EpsN
MTLTATRRSARRIYLSVPHMGGRELEYVTDAFTTNWLSTVGPNLTALESRFSTLVGLPSVALSSGTAALHLALRLVGVRAGDEVVVPTLTFVASANPVLYEGARPVFVDSERRTWNLDPDRLASLLAARAATGRMPRAVIVVHLFGQSAELDPILETCRRYEVPVIEDAAEALGARYGGRTPGSIGDVGVFSFNGNKIITSTGGGMLVSPHEGWTDRARRWSTQAQDVDPAGIGNYVHSEVGFNYRMSNVLAGIARGQLEVLDTRVGERRAVFERYRDAFADLPGLEPQPEAVHPSGAATRHTRWLSVFLVDAARFGMSAAGLIQFLESANIQARPVWKPMHTQPLYRGYEHVGGIVADDLNSRGVCLPSSSSLSGEDQQFVIDCVREAGHSSGRQPRRARAGGPAS